MARHNAKHRRRKAAQTDTPTVRKPARAVNPEECQHYCNKIRTFLQQCGKAQISSRELSQKCRSRHHSAVYQAALEQLLQEGEIIESRSGYALSSKSGCFRAETLRLSRTFGFIRDEAGTEYFVPGKYLLGSMPGDRVLARGITSRSGSPEAEVVSILAEAENSRISGVIVAEEETEGLLLLPDRIVGTPLHIDYRESIAYALGDRVLAVLTERGRRHRDHRVKIVMNFGSADSAASCMTARIMEQGIPVEFSDEALREAEKAASVGVTEFDVGERLDLRGETVFTIDGAASKDLDDAVSVRRHPDGGWELGVHIADVSHYVRQGSALDAEGFERGTSIYYADKVIPMLPPALSNGICSLNQGVDRLTISAVMHLSPEGELLESRFSKSVTRSVIRGVYSECNAVLDGTASTEIAEKYAPAAESLHLLSELTDVLEKRRRQRGAPELESAEAALKLNENGQCIGLSPIERGRSECIIEACMLAANEAAARLAREKDFPLVYRIHEHPDPARIVRLKEAVVKLGMNPPRFEAEQTSPENIRQLLENAKQTSGFQIVNMLTLRAMAKARYSSEPTGHFGLALRDYAHFTSPIRRYPDLAVHRILSDYLEGADSRWLQKRYGKFAENAASHSSDMELRAVSVERDADSCYAAEFMQSHIGERFHGIITGVTDFGIYVTLDNFAEGLLHIHDLPEGSYDYEEGWYLRDSVSGREYRLGGELEVICTRADISSGHIDLGQSSTMTA